MSFPNKDEFVRGKKVFNKGIMDLKAIAIMELAAVEARINKDYSTWCEVLEGWLTKMSADMQPSEVERLDVQLASVRLILNNRASNRDNARHILNQVERKLYLVEKELDIANPSKKEDFWVDTSLWGENPPEVEEHYRKMHPEDIQENEEKFVSN